MTWRVEDINPPNLVLLVRAEVAGGGTARLTRVRYQTPPADGIAEFVLTVDPPVPGNFGSQTVVTVTHEWVGYTAAASWVRGFRVRGPNGGAVVVRLDEGWKAPSRPARDVRALPGS